MWSPSVTSKEMHTAGCGKGESVSEEWEDSPGNTKIATGQFLSNFTNVLGVRMIGQRRGRTGMGMMFI